MRMHEDDCLCEEADVDIVEGVERCPVCARVRRLCGEEYSKRLEQEAQWERDYYEYLSSQT